MNVEKVNISIIEENEKDILTTTFKSAAGMTPIIGPYLAELIGILVPNQRIDRVTTFLKLFYEKFEEQNIEIDILKEKMKDENFINLFDDISWQAAKSISNERKEYLASILINGLTDNKIDEIQKNIFLNIISELNDIEILILYNHTRTASSDKEFRKKNQEILVQPIATLGSSQEDKNKSILFDTYKEKLVRLNLLKRKFKKLKRDELPEFDEKTGTIKTNGFEITAIGRLFLKYIGLLKNDDY